VWAGDAVLGAGRKKHDRIMTTPNGAVGAELSDLRPTGAVRHTLHRPLTSFVGREQELSELRRLLAGNRLLTLTGPGGSGKTRLAIELATMVVDEFPDGVHFVALAAIRDAALVPSSIAQQLGLQDSRDMPLLEHLAGFLRERKVLLVLDNFEQLPDAGSIVVGLLSETTELRIVITSRAPLRISGEQEFPVAPLRVPDPGVETVPSNIVDCESMRLFAARAAAVAPHFIIDDDNAAAITRIVQRLDGLPLAIELAAARVKLLTPAAIMSRLEHSLGLLVGGSRDLPHRQQTLRGTIVWSHDLLSHDARRLLAVCSVFRGGIDLEIVESICATAVDVGLPVLDALQELVDQSMLRQRPEFGAPRYAMLETVRQFAAERLGELLPEPEGVHMAHAAAFQALAGRIGHPPYWPDKRRLDWVAVEHDNFRAAIDWYRDNHPAAALRLAGNLTAFWSARGHFIEGRKRLGELLDVVTERTPERVVAMNGAAWLATDQGDRATAIQLLDDSIALARELRDRVGEGMALLYRGRAMVGGDRIADGSRDVSDALNLLSTAGDAAGAASALFFTGVAAHHKGELETACDRFERCAELCTELDLPSVGTRAVQLLGITKLDLGDVAGARAAIGAALPALVDIGDRFSILAGLIGLSGLAARSGKPRLALRLAGFAEAYGEINQVTAPQPLQGSQDRWLAPAYTTAGAAAAWLLADGRQLTLDEALAVGLSDKPDDRWRAGHGLTRRESEIAELVARGMTNGEIAARLYLSTRTVETHVSHILSKLDLSTRTQFVARAHQGGLLPRK
jgi:predicted ATPase/DNA-binding CsgD family transcriptional regulator